ncbi:unnamed protein product [Orchesella dallaii]|uniref:AB hydrolase-1 domain-containing protein n=1 Tax=Orchesella dallaii TaxID=48710 RepID=A0ABP1RNB5_9HEXA
MKNKILYLSLSVIAVSLIGNYILRYFSSFHFRERKCAMHRPIGFDITFSHRKECLESLSDDLNNTTKEWNVNTVEEIEMRGYNVSTHTILSKDGYYSTMYRIAGGVRSPPRHGKRSILVFHGYSAAAKYWIIQPGNRNLAFTLADAGYEVWLANGRGTTPSKNHTHLDADKDFDYWDFSMDHVSTLDLPLMIDLILQETGTDQIYYACHSGGCAVLLAGLVDVPELNSKVKAAFFLAPGGFLGGGYSPIFIPPILERHWEYILLKVTGGKLSGEPCALLTSLGITTDKICGWSFMRCGICDNFIFAIFGADPEQMDYSNLPNIIKKFRDNGSMKLLRYAKQLHETCEFQRFDFGERRNLLEYGSTNPPTYNLSRMAVPTYIFYGEGDNFLTPSDMVRLRDAVPGKYMKGFHKVDWYKFNHIDFVTAKDADILVYHKIRDIMHKIE